MSLRELLCIKYCYNRRQVSHPTYPGLYSHVAWSNYLFEARSGSNISPDSCGALGCAQNGSHHAIWAIRIYPNPGWPTKCGLVISALYRYYVASHLPITTSMTCSLPVRTTRNIRTIFVWYLNAFKLTVSHKPVKMQIRQYTIAVSWTVSLPDKLPAVKEFPNQQQQHVSYGNF